MLTPLAVTQKVGQSLNGQSTEERNIAFPSISARKITAPSVGCQAALILCEPSYLHDLQAGSWNRLPACADAAFIISLCTFTARNSTRHPSVNRNEGRTDVRQRQIESSRAHPDALAATMRFWKSGTELDIDSRAIASYAPKRGKLIRRTKPKLIWRWAEPNGIAYTQLAATKACLDLLRHWRT